MMSAMPLRFLRSFAGEDRGLAYGPTKHAAGSYPHLQEGSSCC
jgi:hypothetical protein